MNVLGKAQVFQLVVFTRKWKLTDAKNKKFDRNVLLFHFLSFFPNARSIIRFKK